MYDKLYFRDISLKDREAVQQFTLHGERRHCDLSFSNLMSWLHVCGTQWAVIGDTLLLRFRIRGHLRYMMPVGARPAEALQALLQDAAALDEPFFIQGIIEEDLPLLQAAGLPEPKADRDFAEYIYLREDLAGLHGKRLQAKRNFCNRFRALYPDWQYVHISDGNITQEQTDICLQLEETWYRLNEEKHPHFGQSLERQAVIYALHHFRELRLSGGLLYAGGTPVAFTFGSAVNYDTFDVHAEKALTDYEGAYAFINQSFASHLPATFTYLNREEDMGVPGLRQAKLSYHPYKLLNKYTLAVRV